MQKFFSKKRIVSLFLSIMMVISSLSSFTTVRANEDSVSIFQSWQAFVKRLHDLGAENVPDLTKLKATDYVDLWVVLKDGEDTLAIESSNLDLDTKLAKMAETRQKQHDKFLSATRAIMEGTYFEYMGSNLHLINTVALRVPYGKVEALSHYPEIEAIQSNDRYIPSPDENTKLELGRVNRITFYSARQYRGEGQIIAIIDSGFDVNHRDMRIENQEQAALSESKVNEIKNKNPHLLGQWHNIKFPYGYNYADGNNKLKEDKPSSHGTHVAGIAAGSGEHGSQAPEAQVLAMRVFSDYFTGTTPQFYSKAIEDSLLLGARTINMSLGASSAIAMDIAEQTLTAVAKAKRFGVTINIAAGNEGHTNFGTHNPKADNPHYSTVGAPAIVPDALAVASLNSPNVFLPYITAGDQQEFPYSPSNIIPLTDLYEHEYELVDLKKATADDIAGMAEDALAGKGALIERGENYFREKIDNAKKVGALFAVIYNHEEGGDKEFGLGGIERTTIPSIALKRSVGLAVKNGGMRITIHKDVKPFDFADAGKPSDFSSWGTSPEYDLKPEITGIGGSVYAAQPNDSYATDSGTSMASPHVASAAVLLDQRLRSDDEIHLPVSFAEEDLSKIATLKKNILMSTAIPYTEGPNQPYVSPRKQGAGLVNFTGIKNTMAYVTAKPSVEGAEALSKVNLGSVNGQIEFTVVVHNISKTRTLTFKPSATISTDKLDPQNPTYIIPTGVQKIVDNYEPANENIVVQPNSTAEWTVRFDYSSRVQELLASFINGFHVEGFVRLTSLDPEQPNIGLPWIGFHGVRTADGRGGSFKDLPPFERAIYDYPNLTDDAPVYYHDKDANEKHPFTALLSGQGSKLVVLGETTKNPLVNEEKEGEAEAENPAVRSFDKETIAISPNNDSNLDFAGFSAVFLTPYVNTYFEIINSSEEVVYTSPKLFNGAASAFVGRRADVQAGKPETLNSRTQLINEWVWDAQKEGARPTLVGGRNRFNTDDLVEDGKYKFVFHARGHNENSLEHTISLPIYVDRVAPKLRFVSKTANEMVVAIDEVGSKIKEVILEKRNERGEVVKSRRLQLTDSNQVTASVPEAEWSEWYIRTNDIAMNGASSSLATLSIEAKGKFAYELQEADGTVIEADEGDVEVTLLDEQSRVVNSDTWENLVPGNYKAKITIKTMKYATSQPEVSVTVVASEEPSKAIFKLTVRETYNINIRTAVYPIDGAAKALENLVFNVHSDALNLDTNFVLDGLNTTSTPVFQGKLIPGEWKFTMAGLPEDWDATPKTLTATVDEHGRFSFKDYVVIYKTPGMVIEPAVTIEGEGELINATDISWSAFDGQIEHKDISKLPIQPTYVISPTVPEGYTVEPDTVTVTENKEGTFRPAFKFTKLSAKTRGKIIVTTKMKDESLAPINAEYYAIDINGNVLDNLDDVPFGTWYVKPRIYRLPYETDEGERQIEIPFNVENYTTETELVKVVVNAENKLPTVEFVWEKLENPTKEPNEVQFSLVMGRRDKRAFVKEHPNGIEFKLESLLTHNEFKVKYDPEKAGEAFDRFIAKIPNGYYKVTPVVPEGYFAYPPFKNIRFEDRVPNRVVFQLLKGESPKFPTVKLVDESTKLELSIPTKHLHQKGQPYDETYFEFPVKEDIQILNENLSDDGPAPAVNYQAEIYEWDVYYLEKGEASGANEKRYNHGMDLFMEQDWTLSIPFDSEKYGKDFKVAYISNQGLGTIALKEGEYKIRKDETTGLSYVDIPVKKGGKYALLKELKDTIVDTEENNNDVLASLRLENPQFNSEVKEKQEYKVSIKLAEPAEWTNNKAKVKTEISKVDAIADKFKDADYDKQENFVTYLAEAKLVKSGTDEMVAIPEGVTHKLTFKIAEGRTLLSIVHIKSEAEAEVFDSNNWTKEGDKVTITTSSLSPFILVYQPQPEPVTPVEPVPPVKPEQPVVPPVQPQPQPQPKPALEDKPDALAKDVYLGKLDANWIERFITLGVKNTIDQDKSKELKTKDKQPNTQTQTNNPFVYLAIIGLSLFSLYLAKKKSQKN